MRQRTLRVVSLLAALTLKACNSDSESPSAETDTTVPRPVSVSIDVSASTGERLARKPPIDFGPSLEPEARAVFRIDDATRYQEIAGFGASFLEAGLLTLNTLPNRSDQDAVLRALFHPRDGAGFSVMKTVIGGTDFQSAVPEWYTYDDMPGDTELKNFSIARDLGPNGLVTYIKRAREAGGDFILQAPMDYPPDWMLNDLNSDQNVRRDYYDVLANYFVKYLREYEKNGIQIDYVSPFNEPGGLFNKGGGYTKIPLADIRDFIRDSLGPTFDSEKVITKIQLSEVGERRWAFSEYPTVLDDPMARKFVLVLPYHGYDGGNWEKIALLHEKYPDIPMWMTEICCHNDQRQAHVFEAGDTYGNAIVSDLEAGASAWIYWNAILNEEGGPWLESFVHGNPANNDQDSVVRIDRRTHEVTYNGLYYYLAHFSKFVRPGAVRVSTQASNNESVRGISFQNKSGELVAELINSRNVAAEIQVDWGKQSLRTTLPPVSITTLRWSPEE